MTALRKERWITMEKRPLSELMESTMNKLREVINVETVIGEPITADGVTLIPVSKVSFGFGSGGSEFTQKGAADKGFGGGSGAGVKINPIAFVVIKDGAVRIMTIEPPAYNTLDRIVDSAPSLIDQVSALLKKKEE